MNEKEIRYIISFWDNTLKKHVFLHRQARILNFFDSYEEAKELAELRNLPDFHIYVVLEKLSNNYICLECGQKTPWKA